jgi:hypothetical protein
MNSISFEVDLHLVMVIVDLCNQTKKNQFHFQDILVNFDIKQTNVLVYKVSQNYYHYN